MELNDIISSGLLELYAAGLASQEEAAQVLQWARQYPEVADELAQIETSMSLYAQANAVLPEASVKAKIFERINECDSPRLHHSLRKNRKPVMIRKTLRKSVT